MTILKLKDFTVAKQLPPVGLDLMITGLRVQCLTYWANLLVLFRLDLMIHLTTVKYFDVNIALSGNFVLNAKNSVG